MDQITLVLEIYSVSVRVGRWQVNAITQSYANVHKGRRGQILAGSEKTRGITISNALIPRSLSLWLYAHQL